MASSSRTPARWLEHGSYLLVALGAVSAALLTPGHVVGDGVDLYGTFWFYWWIKDSLLHLHAPGFTTLMFSPLGKDIFAHTGDNFVDALVSVPFQAVVGFPRYQPWFVAFVLWGNALAFRPLARHVLGRGTAAWVSTLLWQVAPYTLFELMTGRATQAFLWFPPLAVLGILELPQAGRRWPRTALLAGVALGLSGWTYWFYGYFFAGVWVWMAGTDLVRTRRWGLLWRYAAAALVAAVVVAPAVIGMARLSGEGAVPGLVGAGQGSIFELPSQLGNNVSATLHGYFLMETVGQPMFASLVWGGGVLAWMLLGSERLRLGGIFWLAMLFAIGPALPLGEGGAPIVMPHYMLAYRYLPFFDRLWFPYRLLVVAFMAAALGIGTVLRRLEGRRLPAWVPGLLVVGVALFEQHRHLAWPLLHRDFTPPRIYTEIEHRGGGLVEAPVGLARVSIAWQAVHHQPTFGGMGENAPIFWPAGFQRRLRNSFIRFLRRLSRDPEDVKTVQARDLDRLRSEGFRWVVLDRHLVDSDLHRWPWAGTATPEQLDAAPFRVQDHISDVLGDPVAVEGPLVVWDLQGGAPFPGLTQPPHERTWALEDMPEYERHLREIGRLPQ